MGQIRLERNRRGPTAGITLIELMVAMALMTVLTGTIIFIFSQAQTIYGLVDAKVKVYQYARTALDVMERDLANVVNSADMDFFQDGASGTKNGHYDKTEELGNGVGLDQTEEKRLSLFAPVFHYAFTLRQPKYYTNPKFNDNNRPHAHDSIYFKTITQAQGNTVSAIVEYALVDWKDRERPKLQKRMWIITGTDPGTNKVIVNGPPIGTNTSQTTPVEQDLCLYVTDVQFSIFVKNNRLGAVQSDRFTPGTFYTAQQLVDAKTDPVTSVPPFPPHRNFWNGAQFKPEGSDDYMVQCYYDPSHDGKGNDFGVFEQKENGLFHTQSFFDFPMLGPGDKIFIFDAPQPPGTPLLPAGLQTNDYTVKGWREVLGQPQKRIEFVERITTSGTGFPASGLVCAYRASWLPPAVRVKLRIKDERAKEIRTISRTFKVLASS
jgi:type II secretory pathway pseudopilin PulG